ncbi:MAG TPA: HAD-IC family P-type ATPase, partial [Longimicrobiales bacterium]|nr:HAD-IC family P-type ATPase [Longimicrobiales bacterium]
KGAPEAVIAHCPELSATERERALRRNEELAAAGLRVIGLASASVSTPAETELNQLNLLGLVGLSDPIAPDVPATITRLGDAGIRVIVLTGDHKLTALAVTRALGLLHDESAAIESRDAQQLSDEQLTEVLKKAAVFSRVEPTDKLRIVELLQRRGDIVAMLGDGVNDAIALKKADVGVAMGGRGTDAARETATVVLQDDHFATIAVAVEQGRVIYDNIRRFILYLFSCNFAEILVILVATLAGLPLPILPLQILWLNLVTDTFPAFALAFEPREPDTMQRGPRDPGAAILSRRFALLIVGYGALLAAATLVVLLWGLWRGEEPATLATYGFMTLALVQVIHVGNARSRFAVLSPRRIVANPYAIGALVLVVVLQLAAIYWPPLARVLSTVRPEPAAWIVIVAAALSVGVIGQALKVVEARRH